MRYREILEKDIAGLFTIRTSTDENNLTLDELESLGVTPASLSEKLNSSFRGWLCEVAGNAVGFAMGDRQTGELWVIAVLPEHIKKGIGSTLLQMVEAWLFEEGCSRLWLTTDIDTTLRAYSFYIKNGWKDDVVKDRVRYMVKEKSDVAMEKL